MPTSASLVMLQNAEKTFAGRKLAIVFGPRVRGLS